MPRLRTTSVVLIVVSLMVSVRSRTDSLSIEARDPNQISSVLSVFTVQL